MHHFSIYNILDALKSRLDINNLLTVHQTNGQAPEVGFSFNEPVLHDRLTSFMNHYSWKLPSDYKTFLLLHDGASFFSHETGSCLHLHSLDELFPAYSCMIQHFRSEYLQKNCYPIGYFENSGFLLIDHAQWSATGKENILLLGVEAIDFQCDFKTWLDRIIRAEGSMYWKWKTRVVQFE